MKENLKYIVLLVIMVTGLIWVGFQIYLTADEKSLDRAQRFWMQQKYDNAIPILKKLIEKNPDNARAHQTLALCFAKKMSQERVGTAENNIKGYNKYMSPLLSAYEEVLHITSKDKKNKMSIVCAETSYFNLRTELDSLNFTYQALLDHFSDSQYTAEMQQLQSDYKRLVVLIEDYEKAFPHIVKAYGKEKKIYEPHLKKLQEQLEAATN